MVEAEACRAGDLLERTKVRGGQDHVGTGRPPPAPANGRARDGAERDDHFAHRFDLVIRSNRHADVIGGPCDAPLNEDAVALEPQKPVHGLARGHDLPSNDIVRSTQHEGERGGVSHASTYSPRVGVSGRLADGSGATLRPAPAVQAEPVTHPDMTGSPMAGFRALRALLALASALLVIA